MKKENSNWREWEGIVQAAKPKRVSMKELLEAKSRCGGEGQTPSGAIVDICNRIMKLLVEEPEKFDFPEQDLADRFRMALHRYVIQRDLPLVANRCAKTVYVYKEER